jgi:N-hydroxyarylamine O-acetyltransferase
MSEPFNVAAYLERIGLAEQITLDIEGLRRLHHAHLLRVPFENLDIHLGRPIRLDLASLFDKIVTGRRGGFCYELNGLFASLLKSLGFQVNLLSARVANQEESFGLEFDHLALRVDLDQPYLADVGFGDSFLEPLRLVAGAEQIDPRSTFLMLRASDDWVIRQRTTDGRWRSQYRFALIHRRLGDFAEMCRYHQTSPASHFTQKTVCSVATPTGRVTISGDRLVETSEGVRTERLVQSEAELQTLLADRFDITGVHHDLLPRLTAKRTKTQSPNAESAS